MSLELELIFIIGHGLQLEFHWVVLESRGTPKTDGNNTHLILKRSLKSIYLGLWIYYTGKQDQPIISKDLCGPLYYTSLRGIQGTLHL